MALAQSTATLTGDVWDPAGAAIAEARIVLAQTITGFRHETRTDSDGRFTIGNIPFQTYTLRVERIGFTTAERTVDLRSNIPVRLRIDLRLAEQNSRMDVGAVDTTVMVDTQATGTRTELDSSSFSKLPLQAGNRGIESVLISFPGFAANANGAIHPRGAHNQMTYVVDGMPISDQLTGSFANSIDPSIVQTIELYTGNVPVEFGNKVSGVAVVTTKSGAGSGRPFSGSTQVGAAGYDTLSDVTQFAGGGTRLGYFASFTAVKSHRFLDQVSIDNLHNGGNAQRAFTRVDYTLTPRDQVRLNLLSGRSSFELANLRSQHAAGQRQRQLLEDFSASLGWLRTLSPRSTFDATASYRAAAAELIPSAGDTPVTAAQSRLISTVTLSARYTHQQGRHSWRAGADLQRFPVREIFSFRVTDSSFDSRGLDQFSFRDRRIGSLDSGFVQDTVTLGPLVATLGLRFDSYRFLVRGTQFQPRIGVAYHLRRTGTVLRASYNRLYQTPPNENLLLSSSSVAGTTIGIRPERQNVYEVGLQQGFSRALSLNAAYYHKDSRDLQDNDNFLNTGVIFPTSLARARVNGAEARLNVLPGRRLSGSLSLTHYHAIVTPPFTGGLFVGSSAVTDLGTGPFVIDHDQTLGAHGMITWQLRRSLWISASIRYDSGLVTNPSNPDEVRTDPDYADLLPYVRLDNDPPRVNPRTLTDIGFGYEKQREGRRLWDLSAQIVNIGNVTALYNFQSLFVGTRLVQPRTFGAKLRFYW